MIKANPPARNAAVHDAAVKAYDGEASLVDEAKVAYSQQKVTLSNVPDKVNTLLLRLDRNLEDLPSIRSQAANSRLETKDVVDNYTKIISDLISVRDVSAQLADDTTLADHLRAVSALAQAKEYVAEQRDVGHQILNAGQLTCPSA